MQDYKYNTIMLIDDSDIDNLVNKHIVTKNNMCKNIIVHSSAQNALDYLKEIEGKEDNPDGKPNLILLDINMPIMNGFGFLAEFGKLSADFTAEIKIMMLTSSVDPNDIRRSEESPFVKGFISKPLSVEMLMKM